MTRPRLLDLYCCAGGAGVGYHRAGFEVVGVDIEPRPRYPFEFIRADALDVLADVDYLRSFDVVHASPPCQRNCALTAGTNRARAGLHVDLLPPTRALLDAAGVPYVIEQPHGRAVMRRDLLLCGETFGLAVLRHRKFELHGLAVPQPAHTKHRGRVRGWRHGVYHDGPYVAVYGDGGGKASIVEAQAAMGIDWTADQVELNEAIPPAYTEHIGAHALTQLTTAVPS